MKNRVLTCLGYGLGFFLLTRKERPTSQRAGQADQLTTPSSAWLNRGVPEPKAKPATRDTKPLDRVKHTWNAFSGDDCMTLGAAMAYYSVFSLAPLLLIIISIAGLVFGREAIQNQVASQIQGLVGSAGAGSPSPSLERMVRRFTQALRRRFVIEIARDARGFKKRVIHELKHYLPAGPGRTPLVNMERPAADSQ